jgi:hypothetical protein
LLVLDLLGFCATTKADFPAIIFSGLNPASR